MNAATCTCIIGSMPRLRAWTAANCRIVAVRLALAAQCNRWFDVSQTAWGIVGPSWAMPVVSDRRLGIPGTSPRVGLRRRLPPTAGLLLRASVLPYADLVGADLGLPPLLSLVLELTDRLLAGDVDLRA